MRLNLVNIIRRIKPYEIYLILLALFLIALFFRLYKLNSIPFGLNNDAAWEGSAAINILHGNISDYLPYATAGWRGEGIIRLLVAYFMLSLGNNPITIRLASVIFGIGIIFPLFYLIKNLFNTKLATITTFFVAISGWHITMSKTGWRAITVPFFSTLLFCFYFKAIESKQTRYFVLTGIMLSIASLYTYDAGRIILPFFIFWIVLSMLKTNDHFRSNIKNLTYLLVSFSITSLPMLNYALNNWQNFTSRSEFLFIGNQIQQTGSSYPLVSNMLKSAFIFNLRANGNDFFIFRPLVDTPISWLIPVGLIFCIILLLRKNGINYLFMLFWLLASLIPGILSAPNGNRAIGAVPSVYFLAALGFVYILKLTAYIPKINKLTEYIIILSFFGVSSYTTYFLYLGSNRLELPGFYPETLVTTNYIKTIWGEYNIYITDNYPRELLTYYLYKDGTNQDAFVTNYTWYDSSTEFLTIGSPSSQNNNQIISTKGLAFFMFENYENQKVAKKLLTKYPKAKQFDLNYVNDNINRPASLIILVPPNTDANN